MYDPGLPVGHTEYVSVFGKEFLKVNIPDIHFSPVDTHDEYLDTKLHFNYRPLEYYYSIGKLSRLP